MNGWGLEIPVVGAAPHEVIESGTLFGLCHSGEEEKWQEQKESKFVFHANKIVS